MICRTLSHTLAADICFGFLTLESAFAIELASQLRAQNLGWRWGLLSAKLAFLGPSQLGFILPTLTKGHSCYWGSLEDHNSRVGSLSPASSRKKMGNFLFPWVGFQMLFYLSSFFPLWLFLSFSSASSSSSCRSVFQTRKRRIRWMRKRSNLMPKKQGKIATCSKMPPKFV